MPGRLFASHAELSPELIELHARRARRLRGEAARGLASAALQWLMHRQHRPAQGRLAASVR